MKYPKLVPLALALFAATPGQPQSTTASKAPDKASAYYHFTIGHLYAELAGAYGNRGDYLARAIENYRAAMKADPDASFLAEELSDLYVQSGRLREAVEEAEAALKANPNDVNSRRVLGRIYTRMIGDAQQGKVDETMLRKAIEQYDRISILDPKDADTLLMLGRLQKMAQNSVEAEKAYKKILAIDPNNEDALTGLAIVYADLGNTKESSELLRRVADKNPSLRTLTALAGQYEQLRDYAMAAETLRRTLEIAPNNIEVKRAYAQNLMMADRPNEALKVYSEITAEDKKDWQSWLRVAQIYRSQKQFAKAREAANQAKAVDPNNLEVRYNEVNLLEAEGKTDEAIAVLTELLTSTARKNYSTGERGNRLLLLERLGLMYRGADQHDKAIETFRQIAELDPAAGGRASAQIIDTLRSARQYQKALAESDAAIKKYPEDRVVRGVRASLLAEMGKTDEAVAETKKLLDGKNDRETYITLAQIYEKAKRYDDMQKAIDAAEGLSTDQEDKDAVSFMRGAMYEKRKDFDAAEREFRKVLTANPKNASALNYLGYMLADRNIRLNEALEMIRQAVELDPNNGAYLDSLGWVYYRLGDYEKAEQYLRSAIERYSKDPTVHDHLADVLAKRGNLKDAVTHWERSLEEWQHTAPTDADPAEVAKVQKKLESARIRLARETNAGSRNQQ
jgi:tetratricopeptide (TPR) repeat protein